MQQHPLERVEMGKRAFHFTKELSDSGPANRESYIDPAWSTLKRVKKLSGNHRAKFKAGLLNLPHALAYVPLLNFQSIVQKSMV